jgi:FKBP-type peptidyl-prolyl cis-trans isomerase
MRFTVILLLLAAFALGSCKDFKSTDSGLQYKFFKHDEKGKKPKEGDIIRINFVNKNQKDSVLMSTYKKGEPFEIKMHKPANVWDLMEGFMLMAEGDSALLRMPADSMLKVQPIQGVNPGDMIDFYVKMEKILTPDEYQKELAAAHEKRVKEQTPLIEKFIAEKGLKDVKVTPSGLRYIITNPGTGPLPTKGSLVTVNYKGYLLNGTVFDESYSRKQPFELMLGAGEVIPGWEEGLTYFAKGGKGTLIIPSYLAYGEQGAGTIPASSPIVFDIEVVDVKNNPAPTPEQK